MQIGTNDDFRPWQKVFKLADMQYRLPSKFEHSFPETKESKNIEEDEKEDEKEEEEEEEEEEEAAHYGLRYPIPKRHAVISTKEEEEEMEYSSLKQCLWVVSLFR